MQEGYMPEASQSRVGRSRWVGGPPDVGIFGLNLKGKDVVEIRTFRCPGCGYLESYAWK
jgi:hypothetical protein